jgi:hypothetical protein
MRWTPAVERLGEQAVRRTLSVSDEDALPHVGLLNGRSQLALELISLQWITVHVRHRDFAGMCLDVALHDCFAKLPVFARRVQEVKDELYERRGIKVEHVIMTSDEDDATWWQEVVELGWKRVDYPNGPKTFGEWSVSWTS